MNYSDKRPLKTSPIFEKKPGDYTISRYSLKGHLLETFANARVAAEAMNTAQGYLSRAAIENNKVLTACGFIWRRGKEPEIDLKPLLKARWYGCSPLASQQKIIGQYDLEGNLVNSYPNTVEAAKAVGVHRYGIREVINGRGFTYGGFIWRKFIKKSISVDPKITVRIAKVSQYDLDGRWLRSFKNCYEASKITSVDNAQIHNVLNGYYLTAGGYLWRRGEQLRISINELRKHAHYAGSLVERYITKKRKSTSRHSGNG